MKRNTFAAFALLVASAFVAAFLALGKARASDHDDGEMDLKGRSLNLTDLYVFREDWQTGGAGADNLILIMNTTPRALARQQYFFSTKARYQFHLTRVAARAKAQRPTGIEDVVLRFEFGSPDSEGRQSIRLTTIRDGRTDSADAGATTALLESEGGRARVNAASIGSFGISVFAGLREDSFFFDVERFFQVRALLATGVNRLGNAPTQGGANVFRSNAAAVDFTTGYNVNSIVVRVPIAFLQTSANEPVFDVWETISVPQ